MLVALAGLLGVGSASILARDCCAGESGFIGGVSVGESLLVGDGISSVEAIGVRGGVLLGEQFSAYLALGEFGYLARYWGKEPHGFARRRRGLFVGAGLEAIQGDYVQLRLEAGMERIQDYGEEELGFGPTAWAVPIRGSFRFQFVKYSFVPGIETVVGVHLGQARDLLPWYEFQLALGWRFGCGFSD